MRVRWLVAIALVLLVLNCALISDNGLVEGEPCHVCIAVAAPDRGSCFAVLSQEEKEEVVGSEQRQGPGRRRDRFRPEKEAAGRRR